MTAAAPSLFSLAWQQGAIVATGDGRLDLAEPGTVRAAEFLADLVHGQRVAPPLDATLPADTLHPVQRAYLLPVGFGSRGFQNAAIVGGLIGGRSGRDRATVNSPHSRPTVRRRRSGSRC